MTQLIHTREECAGRWELVPSGEGSAWRCTRCGAGHEDGVALRLALLREYHLEMMLARLAREGAALLARPSPRPGRGSGPP